MNKKVARLMLMLLALVMTIPAFATAIQTSPTPFTIGARTAHSMDIQFDVPDYTIKNELVNGNSYQKIDVKNAGYFYEEGMPELPYLTTMIAIPNHGQVTIEALGTTEKAIQRFIPYPAQADADAGRNFVINEAYYQGGQVFPREAIQYSDPQIMRDFRVITIQIQPFAWNPVTNELVVREQVQFRLQFNDTPGINELNETLSISPYFAKIYESLILNFNDYREYIHANTPPRMVVLYGAYTDATFQNKLNNFAFWKKQKGADIRLLSTNVTGTSNTAIKAYLQGLYNDPMTRPDYIVIVGDVTGSFLVPSWQTTGLGDYPYQMLAGGDQLGDVLIGRISAENTAQLDVIFSKIYAYEKNINVPTADWLNRALIVSDTAHDGISVVYLGRYIQEITHMANPDYTYTMMLQSGPAPSAMDAAMNQGVGFFNYRGYIGMSGWSPGGGLVNGVKLPHAVIITCATGSFGGTATTESFTRLGTAAAPAGAVTAIGMDTAGTHTMPNNVLCGAIFDGIYARGMRTMGEALLNSKLYMASIYGVSQASMVASFTQWCNLMGDPTMEVFITIPKTFTVASADSLPFGTTGMELFAYDNNNVAMENACITMSQNNIILARTYTDAAGHAYLPFNTALAAGSATLTVSMHDFKPLQKTIIVSQNGSLVAGVNQVDDDNVGNSSGNGNYAPNSGERLEVLFSLRNSTNNMINNISGVVTCTNPYVTVVDSTLFFANINAGISSYNLSPAVIQIAPDCPNYEFLHFNLLLTDNQGNSYNVPTHLFVTDAIMRYSTHAVVDANNQAVDPNETVSLNVTISNNGFVNATNLTGRLYSDNGLLIVTDNTGYFGNVNVNGQATTTTDNFTISGRSNILPGMQIPMRLKLTNPEGFEQWVEFIINVGVVTVTSPLGPDSYGYVIYDDGDTSYPECPTYQWVGIGPTPGENGLGTALTISDAATSTEGDALGATSLANVTLPFTFQFYGEDYTTATVCSNGFIVLGSTQDACFRNYRLPGALGPSPMIAAFWDDLATATGSGIYTWFDAANHRYIIEWYHMVNGYQTGSQETFQIILHDPAFYPTSLGDGPIKIQYNTFNNVDSGTGNQEHGVYSTIGIENYAQNSGLEYTFNNVYPTAARHLANNRAIYITNAPVHISLPDLEVGANIAVTTTNMDGVIEPGETVQITVPIQNIGEGDADNVTAVISENDPYVTISVDTADYDTIGHDESGNNAVPFVFSVSPQCPANHVINFSMDIISGTSNWQDTFTLTVVKPELSVNSTYLFDQTGNANGLADPNEDFVLVINIANESAVNAQTLSGALTCTQTGVTISNPNQVKPYLHENEYVQFTYPIHFGAVSTGSNVSFSFALSAANSEASTHAITVVCSGGNMPVSGVITGTVTLAGGHDPANVVISVDNDFYTNPQQNGVYNLYFPVGSYAITPTAQYYIFAAVPTINITAAGMTQTVNLTPNYLADPTDLTLTGTAGGNVVTLNWSAPVDPDYPVQGYKVYRSYNEGDFAMMGETDELTYSEVLVEHGTYTYYVSAVYALGEGAPSQAHAIAYPFVPNGTDPLSPLVNALLANYPNPFNPNTTLAYSIAQAGNVRFSIYNTKGQLIKTLVDAHQTAGLHKVNWNGTDNDGKAVSSGLYLYKVEAGKYTSTRKMMMLK